MHGRKVYEEIAGLLLAMANCQKSGNTDWWDKHSERLDSLVKEAMPSGSGFDNGTTLDVSSAPEKLVFNTSFHHMDENGFYDGWTDHSVIVTPSLFHGLNIRVTGRDRNQIKEYIVDAFDSALQLDAENPFPRVMMPQDFMNL
ncbi:MAG: hypothetical protein KGI27_13375 [Thaumarchaeota archaeon]|nr:hypothetical protein [Nitrososphaerota archaeon]